MKHNDYWVNRSKAILAHIDRTDIDVFAEIQRIYTSEAVDMQKELFAFVTRYADNNAMDYQEALQRLRGQDLSDYQANAKKYREQAEKDPELLKRLNEQYAASKVTRMEALNLELVYKIGAMNGVLRKTFENYLKSTANYVYKKALGGHVSALNEPALQELIRTPFNGADYSEQLWGNTDRLVKDLQEVLKRGFVRGDDVRTMAQELATKYNVARSRAQTLIRTDGTSIINRATIRRYQDSGLEYYRILVQLDGRTTQICRNIAKEDRRYHLDEFQVGVTVPPFHFNCRSTVIPDEEELDKPLEIPDNLGYNQGMDTSQSIAQSMLDEIAKSEPQITEALDSIARSSNGYLAGLDFRLKSKESLIRKIETDSLLEEISIQEAAKQIKDVLRYTTLLDSKDFGKNYDEMKAKLIESGFEVKKVKNTWSDSGPYKGVNTILEKDDIAFEMQYHTQESFELKNGKLHKLYEERRLSTTSKERKLELDEEMIQLSKNLTIPGGIEGVK
ncbi:SPP1 gp7 family putative phage head morphogenesis protein [Streptococcus rupicaprae]|uniref:SPP1 gp7 family putative phage head morphogenesis protein n=1 Tax=Streptococcus rupicaprae TaxID=759619 RepID=A0ABV2FJC9_9STRE